MKRTGGPYLKSGDPYLAAPYRQMWVIRAGANRFSLKPTEILLSTIPIRVPPSHHSASSSTPSENEERNSYHRQAAERTKQEPHTLPPAALYDWWLSPKLFERLTVPQQRLSAVLISHLIDKHDVASIALVLIEAA